MRRADWQAAWAVNDAVLRARTGPSDDPRLPYHLRYVWDGRQFDRRDVLVRCYHGLGDTLQFLRYLPALRARAASVTLEVQRELVALAAAFADHVAAFDVAAPLKPRDVDLEIMELFHALRIPPEAAPPPYLRVDGARRGGIGVCVQAGEWDAARSVPFETLRAALPEPPVLLRGTSIAETAALIACVEHVVSVDTMVAHLAGAMGRHVHVLLKARADWRWGAGARCAWYPRARLYRQERAGEWEAPLAQLARALYPGIDQRPWSHSGA